MLRTHLTFLVESECPKFAAYLYFCVLGEKHSSLSLKLWWPSGVEFEVRRLFVFLHLNFEHGLRRHEVYEKRFKYVSEYVIMIKIKDSKNTFHQCKK